MTETNRSELERKEIIKKYKNLLSLCKPFMNRHDVGLVRKAIDISLEAFKNKRQKHGMPYIFKSFEIARIVIEELGLGRTSILASLLYQAVADKSVDLKEISEKFGDHVVHIIEGVNSISAIATSKNSMQSDNLQMFLLTLAKDVRVLLLQLAIRLYKMRNIDLYPTDDHSQIALETTHLYSPLAHRMGLYNIKGEMDDLSMKVNLPDVYNTIDKLLHETQIERDDFVTKVINPLELSLQKRRLKVNIKWRTKRVHSIYRKMRKQNVEFDEVYDKFAIRIVLDSKLKNEKSDCWRAYSLVTDVYSPNPKRLRDWISIPKSNGYESLHTTVMGPGGKWVEIQIRTKRMDDIAEKGLAAHWRYKGGNGEAELDKLLSNFRDVFEQSGVDASDVYDSFKMNVYSDEVFVFTPNGDLKKLPTGATVLDFAFDIHTDVGAKCVSAKINHKVVPLRQTLKNGDQIEIITSNNQKPKPDWLNFVVTSKAKAKIRKAIDEYKFKIAEDGKEIVKRKFKNWKLTYDDTNINRILKELKLKTAQDLYYQIAKEKIDSLQLKAILLSETKSESKNGHDLPEAKPENENLDQNNAYLLSNKDLKGVDYKIAKCCRPTQGDSVIGFVTIGQGISIHKSNCPNAQNMSEKFGYRQVELGSNIPDKSFHTSIKISGKDRFGLIADISDIVDKDLKLNIQSINVDKNESGDFNGFTNWGANLHLSINFLKKENHRCA
ncbi:RelA/SpoT family protein [Candidatus Venteria ishoeyi]|uniref:GTP pyrophosphokinase n=1 Tax=Candidatus Venteria ishoeyi TaxID=1899563 RepID=A0A1H6FBW0_9GAMM|nr:RelA/SpoT family protein [Candidatus Venteria ishoeyi]SEH07580.1 Bifunctional (p)ppGpp synthase/hydrolase relA [Candidatus Venteria ishoeyi]SEH08570.1 Bifunctional (p)ppGpp synthase/hydrolase relA [Candidatus Venteria ishoeyi]